MATTTADDRMNPTERTTTIEGETRLNTSTDCNRQAAIRDAESRSVGDSLQPSAKSFPFRAPWILVTY
jgi:hypothetical protein